MKNKEHNEGNDVRLFGTGLSVVEFVGSDEQVIGDMRTLGIKGSQVLCIGRHNAQRNFMHVVAIKAPTGANNTEIKYDLLAFAKPGFTYPTAAYKIGDAVIIRTANVHDGDEVSIDFMRFVNKVVFDDNNTARKIETTSRVMGFRLMGNNGDQRLFAAIGGKHTVNKIATPCDDGIGITITLSVDGKSLLAFQHGLEAFIADAASVHAMFENVKHNGWKSAGTLLHRDVGIRDMVTDTSRTTRDGSEYCATLASGKRVLFTMNQGDGLRVKDTLNDSADESILGVLEFMGMDDGNMRNAPKSDQFAFFAPRGNDYEVIRLVSASALKVSERVAFRAIRGSTESAKKTEVGTNASANI